MPETLNGTNHVPWFEAGATIFSKNGIQYLGIPGLINARSILATLIVQVTPATCLCTPVCVSAASVWLAGMHDGNQL